KLEDFDARQRTDVSIPLQEPQRVVLEHDLAALVDHLVREAHQAALALGAETPLDDLALDVDGIAHHRGTLHVERAVEKREARVLHRRQEQALGEGIHERAGHRPALYGTCGIIGLVFHHREQLLGEPGEVDERGNVGLADRAPVGAEAKPRLQVLERKTAADDRDHFLSKLRRARSKASCMLFTDASTPRIISVQASALARCSRFSSDIASSLFLRKPSSWRSYSALLPAWAWRALSSQRAASAFHWSIWVFSFWTYSSRSIMVGSRIHCMTRTTERS